MMPKKSTLLLHPFFLTLYPLLFLFSTNLGQVTFTQVLRAVGIFLLLAGLLLASLRLLLRDWHQAGLLVSLTSLLFFSFGHADSALRAVGWKDSIWIEVAVTAAVFLLGVGLSLWKGRRAATLTRLLNITTGLLLLTCVYPLLVGRHAPLLPAPVDDLKTPTSAQFQPEKDVLPVATNTTRQPDIYYIILDGYAQGSVLQDLYQLDNAPFYHFLRAKGFSVAEDSHTNYVQTILSLGSSLNYAYLDQLVSLNPAEYSRAPVDALLKNSRVTRFLRSRGYTIVTLDSGYEYTNLDPADIVLRSPFTLNAYEQMLLSTTLANVWSKQIQVELYRSEILSHFQALKNAQKIPGPKFVFAHLVVPHPPFVFTQDGGETGVTFLGKNDGSHYPESPAVYRERYKQQILFINQKIEDTLQTILYSSGQQRPVILLQSDHGPGSYLDWGALENTCVRERSSILNAMYLPDACLNSTADLTPVNSFRLVFNTYFGANLPLLPNHTYYSTWEQPYHFQEVTTTLDSCAPINQNR
jgi:hypothetical protein